jgi:HAD superfamily hydrolase (TIGR01509 family)
LLVLDCDGVLVRSEQANVAYYNHLFETFGLPRVEQDQREAIELLHTFSTRQVIENFFPRERGPQVLEYAASLSYAPFLDELELEPGWCDVLGRWRIKGEVAVATNRGASAHAVLEAVGLSPFVDLVVTTRDVPRPKPHPDLLLKVLHHFGRSPREAVYVGDSDLDREAASRATVPFLGFRRSEPPSAWSPQEVERFLRSFAREGTSGRVQTTTS